MLTRVLSPFCIFSHLFKKEILPLLFGISTQTYFLFDTFTYTRRPFFHILISLFIHPCSAFGRVLLREIFSFSTQTHRFHCWMGNTYLFIYLPVCNIIDMLGALLIYLCIHSFMIACRSCVNVLIYLFIYPRHAHAIAHTKLLIYLFIRIDNCVARMYCYLFIYLFIIRPSSSCPVRRSTYLFL